MNLLGFLSIFLFGSSRQEIYLWLVLFSYHLLMEIKNAYKVLTGLPDSR